MKEKSISIVIPLYNERDSLKELVFQLNNALSEIKGNHEYVFIDDGSTDGSFEKLLDLKRTSNNPFKIIKFRKNLGKSAALSVGFKNAAGDQIVTMDADLQDDPNEILKLLAKLDDGYNAVIGWRKDRQDPKNKIRGSYFFNFVVSSLGHIHLHDINCGLKAFDKKVIEEIEIYGELHRFLPLLIANQGFKVTEVPVLHHARKFGHSKFGSSRVLRAFFDLVSTMFLNSFKTHPLQVFGLAGVLLGIVGIFILSYLSYLHFLGEKIGDRPLLFLGILFLLFGVQVFSTGLLGELIANIYSGKERKPIETIIE